MRLLGKTLIVVTVMFEEQSCIADINGKIGKLHFKFVHLIYSMHICGFGKLVSFMLHDN